ncbi:hypothetical protein E3J74_07665 [Candidatus Bathyarchaeota archaeon]|nr:MAG: hypothetical protein E3J74_07665 [Candidatus Bathyarchaeota archaeon]
MGINPILKKMTTIEREIFEVWKEAYPQTAYTQGFEEYAGKMLIPSEVKLTEIKKRLEDLKKRTKDRGHLKFLNSIYMDLNFYEPYRVPSEATNGFFYHLVKEGINVEHMKSLASAICEALRRTRSWLATRNWPTEIRILTKQKTAGLIGVVKTIKNETRDQSLKLELEKVLEETEEYINAFAVEGIKEGDFTEVFPILREQGGDIGHRKVYPKILSDQFDYPETAEEIERKALEWMKIWQPKLIETTRKLATKYGIAANVKKVGEEITKRRNVPKSQVLQFMKSLRTIAQKVFHKNIVRITPKYDTRIIETPPYLVNFIPSAAMSPLDQATDKPFNIFFVTTDEKRSPASSVPDLMQLILHEEYGHCVNFSNSSTAFEAEPSPLDILSSYLHYPISDGISFHRELEFVDMLKRLVKRRDLDSNERKLLEILRGDKDNETMMLENEYVMLRWRMVRFLRAVFDSRVNIGKQTVVDFVKWGSTQTGIDEKTIYNQTFFFLATVGYAPCYSMAGEALRELQELAVRNGKSIIDFNTYASSLGFPGRTIFEEKLSKFATST